MRAVAVRCALVAALLLAPRVGGGQQVAHPVGARTVAAPPSAMVVGIPAYVTSGRPMPSWLKWGLVGAGAGAVVFAALGRARIDREPNPVLQDAAFGAITGFVVIGGAVAFYSWVCAPDSRSRRAGLCGR